jgi:hypothetical protein
MHVECVGRHDECVEPHIVCVMSVWSCVCFRHDECRQQWAFNAWHIFRHERVRKKELLLLAVQKWVHR